MFAESMLRVSWKERFRRGYATLISFLLESLAVGAVLMLPLLYVQGLPHVETATLSLPLLSVAPPPAEHVRAAHSHSASNLSSDGHVIMPLEIPEHPAQIHDESVPAPVDISQLAVSGYAAGPLASYPILNSPEAGLPSVAPPPPIVAAKPVHVSHLMDGYLIYRVQPEYPPLARQARVQGTVVLHALISRDGRIEKLQVVNGHPMLVQSAINAVSQWRYRPYILNNEPLEVETQITVNFTLAGG